MRPSRAELEAKVKDGTYVEFVKSQMQDFCFTINRHTGKERTWFGSHSLTINRNISFSFFDRDVAEDAGLEPHPVIRADATRTVEIRMAAAEDDPSSAYTVVAFYMERRVFDEALLAMESILEEYGGLRTLPDRYFEDSPIVNLAQVLLAHARVKADRAADWPDLLS